MASQQKQRNQQLARKGLIVTDNFYASPSLTRGIWKFSEGNIELIGTMRLNIVDQMNRKLISAAINQLQNAMKITGFYFRRTTKKK